MPQPVHVEYDSDEVYTLDDFEESVPKTQQQNLDIAPEELPDDFLSTLSSSLRKKVEEGPTGKDRSKQEFSVARSLLARGWTVGQTLTVFLHPAWGIGSKTREKGYSYAQRTIIAANDANIKEGVKATEQEFETLRDLVEALHWFEADNGYMKRRKEIDPDHDFTRPCIEFLRKSGMEFLRDIRTDDGYLFWEGRIIGADKDSRMIKDLIYQLAGVTETTWDSRKLREAISHEARILGREVDLHPWIAFDVVKCQGYVLPDNHSGELLVVGPEGIKEAPNGTDGYLLRGSLLSLPLRYNEDQDKATALRSLVETMTPFFATTTSGQQLLTCYIMSIPLQAFAASDLLPILHITGPSGGGKSWALKLMTSWFYGRSLLLRSTQASSYAISDADPLLALDDYETLDAEWQGRLLTGATGLVRTKMGGHDMSRAVLQEGTVSFALTSINPLPTETLRRRAMVVDVDSKRYPTKGFNPTTVINQLVKDRDVTWSGYLKLLSEDILPAMLSGSSADNIKAVQDIIQVPENKGLGTFLSLMWLVATHLNKYVPGFCSTSFEETIQGWAEALGLQSSEEFTERDNLLTLVDIVFDELRKMGDEPKGRLDIDPITSRHSGRLIGFEGTGTQLYSTFARVSRDKGIRFEMTSPNSVGRQFQLKQRLLDKQGWTAEATRVGQRRGWRILKTEFIAPAEED